MPHSTYKFITLRVLRASLLAISMLFVLSYRAIALADAPNKRPSEWLPASDTLQPVVTAAQPLAKTLLLTTAAGQPLQPSASLSVEPRFLLSRIDRQNTPGIDLVVENAAPAAPAAPAACPDEGLHIPERFGASYSTSSAGFDDIIGVNGFIPLDQDECEDITFLEGNVQLNDGDFGFGLNVGHRDYDADDNLINGGYLGIDSRSTNASTFYQVAAGYEHIEEDWELRLNGYLPIGDTTRTIQSIDNDTGVQASTGFAGNELVLSAVGERQRILQQENALGGFDVEIGTQLDDWYGGELMGYVGAYLLSGKESSLGGQARLMANFESNFNAGLSYQYDDIFGSSIGFSIRATLPGTRFQDDGEHDFQEENEVVIRLRDPIVRRPNVAVNMVNDSEIIALDQSEPLRNPEEEEDYRFVHVRLSGGAGTGDGSFENPFGSVEDAIALIEGDAATYSDGNTVVYVDGEGGADIPGFAIPDRVRVLSQGPAQIIAGMEFPGFPNTATRLPFSSEQNFNVADDTPNANGITVSLPDSNDGVFPVITGGANADLVTLNNNTVLAGFEITGAVNHGVTANDVDNVELRNNLIENSGGSGVAFNNVGGDIVLFDNVINNSTDRGIQVENSLTQRPVEVAIAGFDLNNNQVGMEFLATASATEFPSQRVTIGPSTAANTSVGTPGGTALSNSILDSRDEGIVIQGTGPTTTLASAAAQELSISEATVDGSGAAGIQLLTRDGAHSQEFTLTASTLSGNGGNGFEAVNGENPGGPTRTAAVQEIVVRDSTIAGNAGNGIDVSLADASAQELVIRGNQITGNTGDGIRSLTENVGIQEWRTDDAEGNAGISENTITGNGGQAIVIELEDVATIPIASIVNNDVSNNNGAGPDVEFISTSTPGDSAAACLIISDNIVSSGIQLTGPDPLLTGGVASINIKDLPTLLADSNITFVTDEFIAGPTVSEAAFNNELNNCIP